jgi:hypothetical protein
MIGGREKEGVGEDEENQKPYSHILYLKKVQLNGHSLGYQVSSHLWTLKLLLVA